MKNLSTVLSVVGIVLVVAVAIMSIITIGQILKSQKKRN